MKNGIKDARLFIPYLPLNVLIPSSFVGRCSS